MKTTLFVRGSIFRSSPDGVLATQSAPSPKARWSTPPARIEKRCLHASRLRVEALDPRSGVERSVPDPDRARADGDLARPVGLDPLHRQREAVDDLVHRRVDAEERRRVPARSPRPTPRRPRARRARTPRPIVATRLAGRGIEPRQLAVSTRRSTASRAPKRTSRCRAPVTARTSSPLSRGEKTFESAAASALRALGPALRQPDDDRAAARRRARARRRRPARDAVCVVATAPRAEVERRILAEDRLLQLA